MLSSMFNIQNLESFGQIQQITPRIMLFLSVIISLWYSNSIVYKMIIRSGIKNKIDQKHIAMVTKITKFLIYFIGTILILSVFQTQLTTLARTLSMVTIGIGLALQKEISNITSGIFIIFNRSFKINDYIIHKDFEGKIISMDLGKTVLKHNDNIILIPNYILHTSPIAIKKN